MSDNEDADPAELTVSRWVRYTIPVMVEVDCLDDRVTRVVMLSDEIALERDHRGQFMVFDEQFVLQRSDDPVEVHAMNVTSYEPPNWPDPDSWELGFDRGGLDDLYRP